jgi:DNA-binding CsgD family transcriptional regulator
MLRENAMNGIPSSKESAIRSAQGSNSEIAARFHVDPSTVWKIKNRK